MRSGFQTKPGSFLTTQSLLLHIHRFLYDVCSITELVLVSIVTGLLMMD